MANSVWSEKVVQLLRRMNSFYLPGRYDAGNTVCVWHSVRDVTLGLAPPLLRLLSPQVSPLRSGRSAGRLDPPARRLAVNTASRGVRAAAGWRGVAVRRPGLVREKVRGCGRGAADGETGEPLHLSERMER